MKQKKLGDTAEKNLQEKAKELIENEITLTQPDIGIYQYNFIWNIYSGSFTGLGG